MCHSTNPLLELIQKMFQQGVMETGKGWQPTEQGTPQGAVVSPLLANLYLNPLDHLMARQGKEMVAMPMTSSSFATVSKRPKRSSKNCVNGRSQRV